MDMFLSYQNIWSFIDQLDFKKILIELKRILSSK